VAVRSLRSRAWYVPRTILGPSNEALQRYSEARMATAELLTVSGRALRRRFDGEVVRHGEETDRYSSASLRSSRASDVLTA
jgi:hypothetical protein